MAVVGAIMLFDPDDRAHMGMSVLHVRAPMFTPTKEAACAMATRCASPTSGARRADSRSRSAASRTPSVKSEEADAAPDGRLVVSVDPDATQEVQLYVTAPHGSLSGSSAPMTMKATDLANGESVTVKDHFFGP